MDNISLYDRRINNKNFFTLYIIIYTFIIIVLFAYIYKNNIRIPSKPLIIIILLLPFVYVIYCYHNVNKKLDNINRFMYIIKDKPVIHRFPKLYIKKSIIPNAGMGVFAGEFIPKHTYLYQFTFNEINNNPTMFHKINDFAYDGDLSKYEQNAIHYNVINIDYVSVDGDNDIVYLRARRDINLGEELSKYYGIESWRDIVNSVTTFK